jgi:hypothetical protein
MATDMTVDTAADAAIDMSTDVAIDMATDVAIDTVMSMSMNNTINVSNALFFFAQGALHSQNSKGYDRVTLPLHK